jgi:hypothetical protein
MCVSDAASSPPRQMCGLLSGNPAVNCSSISVIVNGEVEACVACPGNASVCTAGPDSVSSQPGYGFAGCPCSDRSGCGGCMTSASSTGRWSVDAECLWCATTGSCVDARNLSAAAACPTQWYNVDAPPAPNPTPFPYEPPIPKPPYPPPCSDASLCAHSSWSGTPCSEVVLAGPYGPSVPCTACWEGGEQCTSIGSDNTDYCGNSNCETVVPGASGPPTCRACMLAPRKACTDFRSSVPMYATCTCAWCPVTRQCVTEYEDPWWPLPTSQPIGCVVNASAISTAEVCDMDALCAAQPVDQAPHCQVTVYNDSAADAAGLSCQRVNSASDQLCLGVPLRCSALESCEACVLGTTPSAVDAPCTWCPTTGQCNAASVNASCPAYTSGYNGVYDARFQVCSADDLCAAAEPSGSCVDVIQNISSAPDECVTCATIPASPVTCAASLERCPCASHSVCGECLNGMPFDGPCFWCTASENGYCANASVSTRPKSCDDDALWLPYSSSQEIVCSDAAAFCGAWATCEDCTSSLLSNMKLSGSCVWCSQMQQCVWDSGNDTQVSVSPHCWLVDDWMSPSVHCRPLSTECAAELRAVACMFALDPWLRCRPSLLLSHSWASSYACRCVKIAQVSPLCGAPP